MITTSQICQMLTGQLIGDPNQIITGPSKIEDGMPGTITFLANPKYESFLYETNASAIIVSKDFTPDLPTKCTLIKVEDVYQSLSILLAYYEASKNFPKGISPTAAISKTASLGEQVAVDDYTIVKDGSVIGNFSILFSQVYIGYNVKIGNNTVIYPGVKIYNDCIIGDNVVIHSNTVIGSDGFGFAKSEDNNYKKIPQIGNVVIEDNVEIGANTVIDRASMGSTLIKKGAKLDNLIQIAHNVEIGENTAIAAQTGIAGSTKVGKNCVIGGQVGLAGHISIADGTLIQAKSGISSNIKEPNSKLYGYPALEYSSYLKSYAYFKKLPDMAEKLRQIEMQLKKISDKDE
jgi:UDP-3-O-[3-hydroxymyristoyl] glucosamine N-acyltransferase